MDSTVTSSRVMANTELERIWKDAVVISLIYCLRICLAGRINPAKASVNLAGDLVEIQDSFTSQITD
jgi:hypothetical protein